MVRVDGVLYAAARLAYLHATGVFPQLVSYKNRDPHDTRLGNIVVAETRAGLNLRGRARANPRRDVVDDDESLDLRDWLKKYALTPRGDLKSRATTDAWWARHKDRLAELTMTPFGGTRERAIWHVVSQVDETPSCPVCGAPCNFKGFRAGYYKYCSRYCATQSPDRNRKIRENSDYAATHEKTKRMNLERYGVEHYCETEEFKKKARETKLRRYGDECYTNLEKSRQTCLERYGVDKVFLLPEVQERARIGRAENFDPSRTQPRESQSEREIRDFLNEHAEGRGVFKKDRRLLGGRELDAYSPELRVAVEYNGLFWHSDYHDSHDPDLAYWKYVKCRENGVSLYTVFEDEWALRNEAVRGVLRAKIGSFDRVIGARECEVRESVDARAFIERFHVQGAPAIVSKSLGLFHEGEQVGVVCFAPHHRDPRQGLTLNRLTFVPGVRVVGGASKLVKAAIDRFKIDKIITWSDNRWSNGGVYERLGFTRVLDLRPDYSYVANNRLERVPKQRMRKTVIGCPADVTEREFCRARGLFRVFDCGKVKWVWRRE